MESSYTAKSHILICGARGVGKSTLVDRLLEECTLPVSGFRTKATPRDDAGLFHFYIHHAGSHEWRFSEENHIGSGNEQGRQINASIFDTYGIACLDANHGEIIVMDELGFMESDAKSFCDAVLRCLDGDIPVLATIKTKEDVVFLNRLRSHSNVTLCIITEDNRDELYSRLVPIIRQWNKR